MRRYAAKAKHSRHLFFADNKRKAKPASKMNATLCRTTQHAGGNVMRADNMA